MKGHSGGISSVSISSDGKRIVTGGNDKLAMIWDAKTQIKLGDSLKGHSDIIKSVCFSPDGNLIVTGSDDKLAMIWDANTGAKIGDY